MLSQRLGDHVWIHPGDCHQEYSRRQAEKAEQVLRRAGLVA